MPSDEHPARNAIENSSAKMSTILSLETATRTCSVALHRDGELLALQEVHLEKSHSSLLHVMINSLLESAEVERPLLDAIAVSMGPGSYTGLRIGASAAKGLCYALDLPLIAVDTLKAMAHEVDRHNVHGAWLCPMIDARRMEVFCRLQTSAANGEPQERLATQALVIDSESFREELSQHEIWFFGNGSDKCRPALGSSPNARFVPGVYPSARWVGEIATQKFRHQEFADVAYFVPLYGKAFYTPPPRPKA